MKPLFPWVTLKTRTKRVNLAPSILLSSSFTYEDSSFGLSRSWKWSKESHPLTAHLLLAMQHIFCPHITLIAAFELLHPLRKQLSYCFHFSPLYFHFCLHQQLCFQLLSYIELCSLGPAICTNFCVWEYGSISVKASTDGSHDGFLWKRGHRGCSVSIFGLPRVKQESPSHR